MRRRRRRLVAIGAAPAALLAIGRTHTAAAQSGVGTLSQSAAQSLAEANGARLVALGGAGVAAQLGAESVLSNPAALATTGKRELSLFHGQDVWSTRDVLAFVAPSRRLGSFAVSAHLWNYGEEASTGRTSPDTVGALVIRNVMGAASYATTFGKRFSAGVTFKVLQVRFDCTGQCNTTGDGTAAADLRPVTSAVDLGAQYDLAGRAPLVLGAVVRHLGFDLQVKDREQADPLPTQFAFGARYAVPNFAARVKDSELHVIGEASQAIGSAGGPLELRGGAELTYRKTYALRGGWLQRPGGDSGGSIGFGYAGKRFAFDVARTLTGFSVDVGQPPTYVTLRYVF